MRNLRRSFAARVLLAVAIVAMAFPTLITPAAAAPVEQICQLGAFTQFDMAGTFVSPQHQMRVEIYPCGGSTIQWDNAFGTHLATYYSTNRIPGGGVAAGKYEAYNGIYLDGASRVGFKPAEPGFMQTITIGDYGDNIKVYRLRKI